ncbi:hypothetical protein GDO78_018891 [Eleutherodactylus coqui]|uniref:Uncharacterized protein n=1 Tax=Eleutherodactylus coqui TaxID=57060 RepID=A0A8J6B6Q5_ELECQ|nr:hypothetical protein GDO78_018891 [Eleutherodactylus coqui]
MCLLTLMEEEEDGVRPATSNNHKIKDGGPPPPPPSIMNMADSGPRISSLTTAMAPSSRRISLVVTSVRQEDHHRGHSCSTIQFLASETL